MGIEITLPYVQCFTDRHGVRRRYYYRRKGWPKVALPGYPGSPEFMAAYHAAAAGLPADRAEPSRVKASGTFGRLISDYENSAAFSQHKDSTKREWRYILRKLEAEHADKPVIALERKHICKLMDDRKETPGAANTLLRKLKVLMSFAIERGLRTDDPTAKIKMLKQGEYRPWTPQEMEAFEKRWPLGTLERTGYALGLYTGQRRTDVTTMLLSQIVGNSIEGIKQEKTGAELTIPIHPELRAALLAVPSRIPRPTHIITSKRGEPLNPIYYGQLMAEAIEKAGLPKECVLHGLRKCAAVALIEAGCSPHEAAAVTGHASIRNLEHYAKKRDQVKLGKVAIEKWENAKKRA